MAIYGTVQDTRELARSVLSVDFSDAEILKEELMAQSKIWAVTRKTDWDASDPQFEFIKKLEIKQAALYVLEHYNAVEILPLLQTWQAEIDTGLKMVADSLTDVSLDEPIKVVSSYYQSYPASLDDDLDSTPFRSTNISV